MGVYSLDTSAVVKRYVWEAGSVWINALCDPVSGNSLHVARITAVEVVSALARRHRKGDIDQASFDTLVARFQLDLRTQLILTIRGRKVLIDADLATIYGVETRTLNQAVKRNAERFPEDFIFTLTASEKSEVITNCDHLVQLKFARSLPFAFTEHGAIMAATVLNSKQAVTMSVYVVRAFIQMREQLVANSEILRRLAEIDKTLLQHNAGLRDIYQKLLPLLQRAPDPSRRRIGFGRTTNDD